MINLRNLEVEVDVQEEEEEEVERTRSSWKISGGTIWLGVDCGKRAYGRKQLDSENSVSMLVVCCCNTYLLGNMALSRLMRQELR